MDNELIELMSLLKKSLSYTTIVYNQSTYNTNEYEKGFKYIIEYKMETFQEDCLLFVVPVYSSKSLISDTEDTRKHELYINRPVVNQENGQLEYVSKVYEIVVETLEDLTPYRKVTEGDIISNRMCIFRFLRGYDKAVLVNSPLFNNASYTDIMATNAKFLNKPVVATTDEQGNVAGSVKIATEDEIKALDDRLSAWEEKIIFGTETPEDALEGKPVGTLYIQLEED